MNYQSEHTNVILTQVLKKKRKINSPRNISQPSLKHCASLSPKCSPKRYPKANLITSPTPHH